MLINPHLPESREILAPIPGTRIVQQTLGLEGMTLRDPAIPNRIWTIHSLYSPISNRALGGIRTKLVDNKGFITFINQRDLEVLIEEAKPGEFCPWLGEEYEKPGGAGWHGFCVDDEDLNDDLFDREISIRSSMQEGLSLPSGLEMTRRVHDGRDNDFEEMLMLMWDADPDAGISPDTRLETVRKRWRTIERTPFSRRRNLWVTL